MRLRELIRADMTANAHDHRARLVMLLFRLNGNPGPLQRPFRVLYRIVVVWIFGIDLSPKTRVGPGLRIRHGTGLVVHPDTIIGANCELKHGCTLGVRTGKDSPPVLGDRVILGSACQILGPVKVGDDSLIGAGAIVLKDVPAGAIAVGNPARILSRSR
jgi:putative colanic acid biosynthesis acetyltransferase WcaB